MGASLYIQSALDDNTWHVGTGGPFSPHPHDRDRRMPCGPRLDLHLHHQAPRGRRETPSARATATGYSTARYAAS